MSSGFETFLIFIVAAAGYLALRILFSSSPDSSKSFDEIYAENKLRSAQTIAGGRADGSSTAPVASDLGRVRVTQFNFAHFDAVPGPPDPECFADELILDLYDSVSDFRWTATYVVATPAGIRKMMDDERWSFFYATEIFIVRRYDLQTIREAVYGRINEVHESVPLDPEGPPMLA